jgi:hypothetical protein
MVNEAAFSPNKGLAESNDLQQFTSCRYRLGVQTVKMAEKAVKRVWQTAVDRSCQLLFV